MKNLLLFVFVFISLSIYGQVELDGISQKIKKEYVFFNRNKLNGEIQNMLDYERSLTDLSSWYRAKVRMKGDIGASISAKLYGRNNNDKAMIQYAITIINYNQNITKSVLGEENYQVKLNKLIEKTQKGKVTPELGQIITKSKETCNDRLQSLNELSRNSSIIKDRQTREVFDNAIRNYSVEFRNKMKDYIVIETVEEDNPDYLEAIKRIKKAEELSSLPHQKYSGSYGQSGSAQYSYKETLDGERIYDGKWFYKNKLGNLIFTSEGQYKNDIRVGKWVWSYKVNGMNTIYTLNFDDEGYLHGEVTFSDPGESPQKVYFKHGRVIGKYTNFWDPLNGGYINIEFDQSSVIVGTATFKEKFYVGRLTPMLYTATYENGKVKSLVARNYQTGDKINRGFDIEMAFLDVVIFNGISTWPYMSEYSPDRKSPKIDIYE